MPRIKNVSYVATVWGWVKGVVSYFAQPSNVSTAFVGLTTGFIGFTYYSRLLTIIVLAIILVIGSFIVERILSAHRTEAQTASIDQRLGQKAWLYFNMPLFTIACVLGGLASSTLHSYWIVTWTNLYGFMASLYGLLPVLAWLILIGWLIKRVLIFACWLIKWMLESVILCWCGSRCIRRR